MLTLGLCLALKYQLGHGSKMPETYLLLISLKSIPGCLKCDSDTFNLIPAAEAQLRNYWVGGGGVCLAQFGSLSPKCLQSTEKVEVSLPQNLLSVVCYFMYILKVCSCKLSKIKSVAMNSSHSFTSFEYISILPEFKSR